MTVKNSPFKYTPPVIKPGTNIFVPTQSRKETPSFLQPKINTGARPSVKETSQPVIPKPSPASLIGRAVLGPGPNLVYQVVTGSNISFRDILKNIGYTMGTIYTEFGTGFAEAVPQLTTPAEGQKESEDFFAAVLDQLKDIKKDNTETQKTNDEISEFEQELLKVIKKQDDEHGNVSSYGDTSAKDVQSLVDELNKIGEMFNNMNLGTTTSGSGSYIIGGNQGFMDWSAFAMQFEANYDAVYGGVYDIYDDYQDYDYYY
jgi:hypothetical protein